MVICERKPKPGWSHRGTASSISAGVARPEADNASRSCIQGQPPKLWRRHTPEPINVSDRVYFLRAVGARDLGIGGFPGRTRDR